MFSQTLFLDLVLYRPPSVVETPAASASDRELQLILAPRTPDDNPALRSFLDFSQRELQRAHNHRDEEAESEAHGCPIRDLPENDNAMVHLGAKSRLRVARERRESSPSSSTSWHGPAHLDFSVATTTLAFDYENRFKCIAYESAEQRCEQVLSSEELACAREVLGDEFTNDLPPEFFELLIPVLLCPTHQSPYWVHAYYQKWSPSFADSNEEPPQSPPSLAFNLKDPIIGHRRMAAESFSSEESTHESGAMVLRSPGDRQDYLASGEEAQETEPAQALGSEAYVADDLAVLSLSALQEPSGAGMHLPTPGEAPTSSRPSSKTAGPAPPVSPQEQSVPKSSETFDGTNFSSAQFTFDSPLPSRPSAYVSRATTRKSRPIRTKQSWPRYLKPFPAQPEDPPRAEPYRIEYHSFDPEIRATLLADESNLLAALEKLQQGQGVVPRSVRALCATHPLGKALEDKHFSAPDPGEVLGDAMKKHVYEWHLICDLRASSLECQVNQLLEAAWNAEVHSTVLRLALQGERRRESRVWYRDISTASILRSCLHCSPFPETSGKKVDYAVILEPSDDLKSRIRDKVERDAGTTINHTAQAHLRYQPIVISIETKRSGEGKTQADKQLLIWVSAHITRLRQLLRTSTQSGSKKIPALPLVLVQGHDWKLYMAKVGDNASERRLDVVQEMAIGSTASILGIYTLISSLRRLAEWAEKEYRPWFVESVLG
ncbi:hypothetical protein SLS56_012128 [Neofusicoccum ribis]|uniref:PD-(D/E)XK nuclease-like domain-containing protein n=1 Tax=Neofusicoccum ribis TaxID=45134 RepID=A0ABR3S9N4_9PEZI